MQSATAPDPSTVVFTMVKPNVAWPAVTAQLAVVSQKAYTAEGPTKFATDPLGSGPYSLVSFNPGSTSMVLKANPNWWAGEPKARNVTITQVADATTRLNGLQSGQYDLAILTGDQVATAKGAGLNTYSAESTKTVYVGFNTNGSDTSSLALREAFSYAIDRSALVKTLLSGFAVPTGQLPPPALNNYDPSIQAPAQDIAKAKALVQQSGYSGQTITLEYTTAYVNAANQVAQAIVGYMSAVGVKLKLVVDDSSTFISNWFGKKIPGAYLMSIQSGSPDSASTLTLLDKSAATFTDPTITSLMAQQAVEVDPAARVKLLQQLTQVNNTQAYYVPLYTDDFNFAWSKKISFTPPSNGYLFPTYISGS
jgi:peptide/nickel transport system substrate-binding protein